MYKFEISADTPAELKQKQLEFALEIIGESRDPGQPTYIDADLPRLEVPATPAPLPQAGPKIPTTRIGLDSRNIPWDERVHSSSKAFNKDGTWRLKRGVDDALVKAVEADLKNVDLMATIAVVPPPPVVPAAPVPAAPPVHLVAPVADSFKYPPLAAVAPPVEKPRDVAPIYDNVPIPSGNRPAHSYATFKMNFNHVMNGLILEGKIDQEYIAQVVAYYKEQFKTDGLSIPMNYIWNLTASEKHCLDFFERLIQQGFITEVEG